MSNDATNPFKPPSTPSDSSSLDSASIESENDSRYKWQITMLLTMYVGYAAFMLCRNTLGAASTAMIEDPDLAMNTASYGRLMSWHSAGAIAGKLVTGIGADLLGGRRMFLIALALTAVANIGFAMSTSLTSMGVFNFLGQFFKAGGWPAMTKLVAEWYPQKKYGQVWSIISTSSRVGTICAGLFLGFLIGVMPWRAVFVVSAVFTLFVVVGAFFLLKNGPQSVGLAPLSDADKADPGALNRVGHPFDDLKIGEVLLSLHHKCAILVDLCKYRFPDDLDGLHQFHPDLFVRSAEHCSQQGVDGRQCFPDRYVRGTGGDQFCLRQDQQASVDLCVGRTSGAELFVCRCTLESRQPADRRIDAIAGFDGTDLCVWFRDLASVLHSDEHFCGSIRR